jgi:hypothetical protein
MVGANGFEPSTCWSRISSRNTILLARLALFCVEHADMNPYSAAIGLKSDPYCDWGLRRFRIPAVRGANSCESDAGGDGLTGANLRAGEEWFSCHGRLGRAMEGPCSLAGAIVNKAGDSGEWVFLCHGGQTLFCCSKFGRVRGVAEAGKS